ncbi:MAG TPA: LacI family DNA-binding transcriptional regulator [Actinomycetes bacterium]|nr:LacI family DNA-binding transcriptional regulator [Actinomycetes bacterium]
MAGKQTEGRGPTQSSGGGGKARSDINDVARMARVSRQTVSNVLNNRTGYSEETRTRVLRAIEALDYQPHRAARSLRSQRTMQLGYHMPGEQLAAENAFVLGFIQALVRAAADHGHHVLVFTEQDDELEVFRELVAIRGVDGFILSGSRGDDPRAHYLHEAGVPFAVFGRTAPGLPQTWVDIDSVAAASSAVDYLVGRGHERLAYVGYDAQKSWDVERLEGFRKGLADHGIRVPERSIIVGRALEAVHADVLRLLGGKRRPTAIVTGSDVLAAVVVNAAKSLGLRVGQDLAVTGFDGGFVRHMTEPVLTSVRIPVDRIAAELIACCLRMIDDGTAQSTGILVPTEIAVGASA